MDGQTFVTAIRHLSTLTMHDDLHLAPDKAIRR